MDEIRSKLEQPRNPSILEQPISPEILNSNSSSSNELWVSKKGLHITHLNIHYLLPKLDEIRLTLNKQCNIDIFSMCETFLSNVVSDNEIDIHGYSIFRRDRQSLGGGLIIYYKNNINCIRRLDLENDNSELMWLEVKQPGQSSFLLCYCYRPPSEAREWIDQFEACVEKSLLENKETLVLGDVNYNILDETPYVKPWLRMITGLNLKQVINFPTRVTSNTKTLIDHVYTNTPENIVETTVPCYSISDHYPVCITRECPNSFLKDSYIQL